MDQKSIVSVTKVGDGSIEEAVNNCIDLIGGLDDLERKKTIAIKPNLCGPKSSRSGMTTDPTIVESLIKKLNSIHSTKINIVETNNSHATADKTFTELGYRDIANKFQNVECINLSKDARLRMSLDGELFSTILVPETMIFSDYLINVAKLKTHVDYYYTGALKNAYGFLLARTRRRMYHGFMHKALVDLNRIYRPDLSIIDGTFGMEGFGPTDGNPKWVGVIVASKDPVAADSVAAQIMGINPSKIKHLKYAEKKGIGNYRNIEVVGCDIEEVKTKFKFIPLKLYYIGRLSLMFQRFSWYYRNFGRFLGLVRSALSTIGFSDLKERSSYKGLLHLAKDTIFKING